MDATICFFIILQETQTGETLKYCTISTLWNGNLCSNNNKYMRYILRWKFIEHKEVPEMLTTSQDSSCWRLIIQTLTCVQLSLVMCKRLRNARARILQHLGRRVSHHPPHFPWPRVRDWGATEDESATNPGAYNLRFFGDLNTSCSYQWFPETDVSWCRVYLPHLLFTCSSLCVRISSPS